MKKILLATTLLASTAGFAAAEVTLSGDARMGVTSVNGDAQFSSRARVSFNMTGETDGDLSFGASFRADNAGDPTHDDGASDGLAGSVFISGAFGKLSMGDNDTAAQSLVGQVDGVGYTSNGTHNEIAYLGDASESVLYSYSAGDLTFAASIGQIDGSYDDFNDEETTANSVAVSYAMGDYSVALGYETGATTVDTPDDSFALDSQISLGGKATFGAVTVKAVYATADGVELTWDDPASREQYALSATYTADAVAVTGFLSQSDIGDNEGEGFVVNSYGLGVAYDLGGGAKVKAGYTNVDSESCDDGCDSWSDNKLDAGVVFSF